MVYPNVRSSDGELSSVLVTVAKSLPRLDSREPPRNSERSRTRYRSMSGLASRCDPSRSWEHTSVSA